MMITNAYATEHTFYGTVTLTCIATTHLQCIFIYIQQFSQIFKDGHCTDVL